MPDNVYVWMSLRRDCQAESRRTQEIVLASSKADVLRTIGETRSPNPFAFDVQGARTPEELAVARSAPGVIFWRSIAAGEGEWWMGTDGSRVRWAPSGEVVRRLALRETDTPKCPGANCSLCSGEVCAKCGAGMTLFPARDGVPCEHDVLERHEGVSDPALPGDALECEVIIDTRPKALLEHVVQLLRQAPPARLHIIAGFLRERPRQDKLHPFDVDRPDGTGGPDAEHEEASAREEYDAAARTGHITWRKTLRGEVAEAFASIIPEKLATELLQVMALAGKWLEALYARGVKVRLP